MHNLQEVERGRIFQIQRFSLDDGPGIRTTIFFKGCNLHCAWCHNPESIHSYAELAFEQSLCIQCGACAVVCRHGAQVCDDRGRFLDWSACTSCMECTTACSTGALSVIGQEMNADEVLETILRDKPFYVKSGGGVSFSGGEPLLQVGFLLEVLKLCHAHNLHTAVDTAGNVPFDSFLSVLPYTNLFLYDIKVFDPGLHRRCTGVDNTRILENLKRLVEHRARVWVRLPYIPGFNNEPDEIGSISAFLRDLSAIEKVELLPYHSYGEAKYGHLGSLRIVGEHQQPDRQELLQVLDAYKIHGVHVDCPTI